MNELEQLKEENRKLLEENERLKNRGAGRKKRFDSYQVHNIKNLRSQGKTYKEIAEKFGCSASLIHKLVRD